MRKIIILLLLVFIIVSCGPTPRQIKKEQLENAKQCVELSRARVVKDFESCHQLWDQKMLSPYEYLECQNKAEERFDRHSQQCIERYQRFLDNYELQRLRQDILFPKYEPYRRK